MRSMTMLMVVCVFLCWVMEASARRPCTYGGSDLRPCPRPIFIVNPSDAVAPTVIVEPAVPVVEVVVEPATCTGGSEDLVYQYAGTSALTQGYAGPVAMTRACQAEYGGGARMCNTVQFRDTESEPWFVEGDVEAWIMPTWGTNSASYDTGAGINATNMLCKTIDQGQGITVLGYSIMESRPDRLFACYDYRPVACCTKR
jgi:hypothetical protein